jgi:predicted nucleotidyltransferase
LERGRTGFIWFRPENEVEVLVTCPVEWHWSHFDLINMQNELEPILDHKINLVERSALEQSKDSNRREQILSNTEIIYAA